MKKLLFISLLIIFFIPQQVLAKTYKVVAEVPFDSNNPPREFAVKLKSSIQSKDNQILYSNGILKGYIYQTIQPKRLKQSATFVFIPTEYINAYDGSTEVVDNIVTKYTTKFNFRDTIVNSLYFIGGVPVALVTASAFALQGAIQDSYGDLAKSSVENVYKNSPLSLIEKGDYLKIAKGENFLLQFVIIKNDEPNYNFKPAN